MPKQTTASLKVFIAQQANNSPTFRDELEAHDIEDVSPRRWSRTRKAKIRTDTLDDYAFIYDESMKYMEADGMAMRPSCPAEQLVGCIERGFLHKEADCYVGIITDPSDHAVVSWFAQID